MLAGAWLVQPGAGMRHCAHAARGSCARRSSSGLGVPTAFNRAGEGPRAGGGSCPGFPARWSSTRWRACSPWGNGLGSSRGRSWHVVSQQPGLRLCGDGVVVAELAGGDPGIPAGAVHHQRPDPAQQRRGAGDAGLLGGRAWNRRRDWSARRAWRRARRSAAARPGGPPGGQPQRRRRGGRSGSPAEAAGLVAGRGHPGMLDQRRGRLVLAQVTGLGQDRGQRRRGQAGDLADPVEVDAELGRAARSCPPRAGRGGTGHTAGPPGRRGPGARRPPHPRHAAAIGQHG